MFTGDAIPKSMKLKLKGGAYVDPESGLEDKAHVLKRKEEELFSVVLNAVNVQKGMNSYYKLQVLEHDKKPKCDHSKHLYIFGHFFTGSSLYRRWYVFRSWGRVGTTIGGTKLESFEEKEEAMQVFKDLYEEKTGNAYVRI